MDLGTCAKIHDVALRADYESAIKEKDYFYDIDVSVTLLHICCMTLLLDVMYHIIHYNDLLDSIDDTWLSCRLVWISCSTRLLISHCGVSAVTAGR